MTWYHYITAIAVLSQLVFMYQVCRNFRYALKKSRKNRCGLYHQTILIIPCKDKDVNFEENIASFFNLDNKNYLLWFVVEDKADPAYGELCRLREKLASTSKAKDIQVHIAGKIFPPNNTQQNNNTKSYSCSQKIHNLLYCYHRIPKDVKIIAFADSDICVPPHWLNHLIAPLYKSRRGATTGYRWFVPQKNNLATLALASINARIAQLLGDNCFNHAWGGSMAIRVETFREVGLDKIWPNTVSDDLSLTVAVKKAGKRVIFAPACLAASHEKTSWKKLFEFGRRQFLITRVCAPRIWWFGLFSSLYSVFGLWGTAAIAVYAAAIKDKHLYLLAAVPVFFFFSHLIRAILRQKMAAAILKNEREKMKVAMAMDIIFFWIWSIILLFLAVSSIFGRTITWRGIRYKLLSPTKTVTVNR